MPEGELYIKGEMVMNREHELPKIIFEAKGTTWTMRFNADCNCDCACVIDRFVGNNTLQSNVPNMVYSASPFFIKRVIDLEHYAILSPFAHTVAVLNTSAMTCLQHFTSPKPLTARLQTSVCRDVLDDMVKLGLLLPEHHPLLKVKACTPTFTEVSDILSAWLHITDRCNLRCAYCYLPHKNADMSLETGREVIEATFRSAIAHNVPHTSRLRMVKFKYAGGEPLLRFPFITELHRYAQQLAEQYELGLDGVVLSNGTLVSREMIKEMQALGLRLMISLDNLPTPNPSQEGNTHPYPSQEGNCQRVYPDGRDASDKAMRAIELALEGGLTLDVSITVTGRNVQQLPELLEWVLKRDLPFSLNFYRPSTSPFDKLRANGYDDLKLEEEKIVTGLLNAYKVIEANLPRRSLLASLADMANFAAPHLRRCSVGHSYLVFDTEGRVSKCQMQMDKPVTDIHADDPLTAVRNDSCGIQNLTVDEKEGCQECQWKYWCGGGCPLETFRATGRYDLKSPNCTIYKALYPEVLRLEGLRLLKYAGEHEH
jgi:uncharacterized protein